MAVFHRLPEKWVIVETDTVETFLGEDMTDLGVTTHFRLLAYEYGDDGFGFLIEPSQETRGEKARVSFIVPDEESVEGPSRPTKSGQGVLRLVVSR